jgi:tyrosyl-tRNA synthetase
MANNADWLNKLNYIDFLRDVGKHFSVNRMLAFDSVKLRLDRQQELSFLEFNYMVLQAYDFVELHKRTGCILQMGGSDQWGNIINGIDLGRRMMSAQLFALTSPLITTSSGAKMGKTAAGAIWLDANLVGPTDYWQFWRNTEDRDVASFLKLFTTLPLNEIERLSALKGEDVNEAKKILATEATALVHGGPSAQNALRNAQQTYEKGNFTFAMPTAIIPFALLDGNSASPFFLANACVLAEFARTTSEARKKIKEGVIKINDKIVVEEKYILTTRDLTPDGIIKLSLGKKQNVLLKPE